MMRLLRHRARGYPLHIALANIPHDAVHASAVVDSLGQSRTALLSYGLANALTGDAVNPVSPQADGKVTPSCPGASHGRV
ncbi:MAG: hypothetical protein ACKVIH_00280 [Burkholderiales bacterium]